jgi:dienelactone hydrolase
MRTVVWVDDNPNAGGVSSPLPSGHVGPRKLVTEIWYPALGASSSQPTVRARPDYGRGPFPVVVFAHGFDTLPSTYTPLLASWVNAGYVVVAPLFPDENADLISSLGDATTEQLSTAESDIVNEPYDIAYVVGEVESGATGAASSGAPWLKGLVEPGKFALAGHSDGAQAVAALVYAQRQGELYATTYAALPAHPFAVVILSGSELSGSYAAPAAAPPLLFVQSAVDECNLPSNAVTLLHDSGGGFFLKLLDANHFGPYVGKGRAAGIVEKTTVAFLNAAQSGTPSASELTSYLTPPGVAVLYAPGQTPVVPTVTPTPAEETQACSQR